MRRPKAAPAVRIRPTIVAKTFNGVVFSPVIGSAAALTTGTSSIGLAGSSGFAGTSGVGVWVVTLATNSRPLIVLMKVFSTSPSLIRSTSIQKSASKVPSTPNERRKSSLML